MKRVVEFLGLDVDQQSQTSILKHLGYQSPQSPPPGGERDAGNGQGSFRLNKAGLWRSTMTRTFVEKFDRWTKEKLAGTDFSNVFMII